MGKKKPQPTIFRTTISVPFDLKERMDAADGNVNWSAVACRAFEAKLAELVSAKKEKNMQDVIQRLRVSYHKSEDVLHKQGVLDGHNYAKNYAEAEELQRLQALVEGRNWDDFFVGDSAFTWGDHLLQRMRKESGRMEQEWKEIGGDDGYKNSSNEQYCRGFVAGCLEIWDQVEGEL